jgi:2-keto-3-deoxy-L-rhamnonate aldolase RhmA
VAVQIETAKAVDEIDKIAAVPGIDMLFIGPRDLSASLGKLNRFDDPELKALIATAEARILGCGKYLGSVIYPGLTAADMYRRGYHLLVGGSDTSFLLEGARTLRASVP